jgi:hypothetical protein
MRVIVCVFGLLGFAVAGPVGADELAIQAQQQESQTVRWNRFVDHLYDLHQAQVRQRNIRVVERVGGYAGHPEFYREQKFLDAANGRLLSLIQWEKHARTQTREAIHSIEIYVYDAEGRVLRDYLASYLPEARAAPIQALLNLHAYPQRELHAFRQFDASGARVYETCRGRYRGQTVDFGLEEDNLGPITSPKGKLTPALYQECFSGLPLKPGDLVREPR